MFIPSVEISSPFSIALENLKCLNLNSNRIKVLKDFGFKSLTSLEELYLGYNCIETISGNAFVGLKSLKKLILTSNRIKYFHENTFCALKSLEILYLSSNRIERLNKNFFHGLTSISSIYLLNNPIRSFNKLELLDSRYTMSTQVKIFIWIVSIDNKSITTCSQCWRIYLSLLFPTTVMVVCFSFLKEQAPNTRTIFHKDASSYN